jgi:hypothetical protein
MQTFGNAFEEVQTHMTGMELMVEQRGMTSLGVYPFGQTIRKYLVLCVANHFYNHSEQHLMPISQLGIIPWSQLSAPNRPVRPLILILTMCPQHFR